MLTIAAQQEKEVKQKLTQWIQHFRNHKVLQAIDVKLSLAQQKPSENPLNKFYLLKLKHIGNLLLPRNNEQSQQQDKFYSLQMNVTLYNTKTGFFGRTYKGKQIPLKTSDQSQELAMQSSDWIIFYTQSEAMETKAVVEILMIVVDKNQKKQVFGVGYAIIPIFIPDQPLSIEIFKGTPRDIMKMSEVTYAPLKTGSILYFEFKQMPNKLDHLMSLLPDNCLFGENDELPGVQGSHLPSNIDINTECKIVKMQAIYAHNIRISSMNEIESCFIQFLKDWKKFHAQDSVGNNAEIQERKLTVVPHNSWRSIGSQSFVSLNKEINGVVQSSGAIKILNFPLHPLISLIFKLEYRVQYINDTGKQELKDFVLGWCQTVPLLTKNQDNIQDQEIQLELVLGPGMTILGDVLWDQTLKNKQKKIFIKMGLMLTSSEDIISEIEKKRQQDIMMKEAEAKVKKQLIDQESEKQKELGKLKQIKEENERLKKEKEELEQMSKKPTQEILKETIQKQEIVQAKEYYKSKNEEVEQLIEQVLKSQKEGVQSLPTQIAQQSESNISSLLRVLIQLVLSNYGKEADKMTSEARQEMTKNSLMELLKGDQSYKMNVFGSLGGMSLLQSKELSRQDKINLIRLGIGKNLLDPETEAKLIASEPRMDFEVQDQFKASTITMKFVAYKTPLTLNTELIIPQKMCFTFKFFTFKAIESEKVLLKLPPELEIQQQQVNNQSQLNIVSKMKLNAQYCLAKLSSLQQDSSRSAQNNIETNFQIVFDIDPSISKVQDENLHLARYLKDKVLSIDIWNGDSLMHFGTCKVPLHSILRQGEPSKVIGQQYDVSEPEFGSNVGGLQLLITNQGRKIFSDDENFNKSNMMTSSPEKSRPQTSQKHKKKVLSKPIENLSQAFEGDLSNLAQAYEFQKSSVSQTYQSEEARKRLRVERLKRLTVANEVGISNINDPKANEWQKLQSLKQIEMLRESKKSQLLTTVLKESMQFKQTINVIPGQIELIQFLVQNPFPQNELFQVVISDPDENVIIQPELSLVHNESHEWQFWFNSGKCAKPNEWDLVSSKQDLILGSGQQCPLLFKFLSFREPINEINNKQQCSPSELRSRKIKISVLSKDRMPVSTMELKIIPREQFCDQTFRYYEPQNVKSYIKIPSFVPFNLTGMTVISSNKEIKADINQNGEIFIVMQTNKAPQKTEGNLYLYQDQYLSQMLACCKVEVYALTCIRQRVQAGPDVTYQLQVRSQVKRTVEIYSSNPRLVFPPGKKERNLQILQPNEQSNILIGVKASVAGQQRARIHCVDINTKELVQAWLFEIEADKPLLQKAYQIELVVGRHYPYKFQFVNPLPELVNLEIVSSKPSIMQVRKEKQQFQANEKKDIDLYFPPQNKPQQYEAILYINDENDKVKESILFQIIVKE